MPAINSALALVAGATQTGKGVPAANPTFSHGVAGGQVLTLEIEQEPDDVTAGQRVYAQVNRTAVTAGADWEGRAYPASVGLWLLATFGDVATTGVSPELSHVFTAGDDVPYLTAFSRFGQDYHTVQDFKIDSAEFSWDGTEPLGLSLSGMGTILGFPAGPWTADTDDSRSRYLVPVGGTFELAGAGDTPAPARIRAGNINIGNNLETILLSGSVVPDDVHVGRQEYEVGLTVIPENLNLWREIVTGSDAGTEVNECPVFGSFRVKFVDPCDPAVVSLSFEAFKVPFLCDFPSTDPAGAPAELELTGVPILPAAGAALTATLVNDVAAY